MINELLLAAGVPESLWADPVLTQEYLCKKVIALSVYRGDIVALDEEHIAHIEERTYQYIKEMSTMDVFRLYNTSYLSSLSELERLAVKAALCKFVDDRNIQKPDYWM